MRQLSVPVTQLSTSRTLEEGHSGGGGTLKSLTMWESNSQ